MEHVAARIYKFLHKERRMLGEESSTQFSVASDFPHCGSVLSNKKSVSVCLTVLSLVSPKWTCLSGIDGVVNQAHKSFSHGKNCGLVKILTKSPSL